MTYDYKSISMEPEAEKLQQDIGAQIGEINNTLANSKTSQEKTSTQVEQNTNDIAILRNTVVSASVGGSPNSVGNLEKLTMIDLQPADVIKFLKQSAEQKAQGQVYAGKYSLTPQRFDVDSGGNVMPAPYGKPQLDWTVGTGDNDIGIPIITDSCFQYHDPITGLHYRWDQYQKSSKEYAEHWTLDGPIMSVSLDGLQWVNMQTLLFGQIGPSVCTGFWVDRDNRMGVGKNALAVCVLGNGVWALPRFTSMRGTKVGQNNLASSDHRLYWDSVVVKGFLVLAINNDSNSNNYLQISSGTTLNTIQPAFTYRDDMMANCRCECPSWVRMSDQVAGKPTQMVLSLARQQMGDGKHYESVMLGVFTYNVSSMTMVEEFRYVEWGAYAYAQILVDPEQQDGTGGTGTSCSTAIMNNGCYNWDYINGNWKNLAFGFAGGQWLPSEVQLVNGIPMCFPSSLFAAKMTGPSFTQEGVALGVNAVNPGWTMYVTKNCEVWRLQMYFNQFSIPVGSTIRLHFGSNYADYTFSTGYIDFIPNNSGNLVMHPNNQGGASDSTTRMMPMARPFTTATDNTLTWEYDYGRLRMYNHNTGEMMSECIYPNGQQLTAVEVIGNDFFVGGFNATLNQDSGLNY